MRRVLLFSCSLALTACASEQPPEEMAPPPPGLAMADVMGEWSLVSITEAGDTVASTLIATADMAGWKLVLQGRDTIMTHGMVEGDSVVTTSGPFESVLRPGVMVTTSTVSRLVDGELVGALTARYEGAGADSVLRGTTRGTRQH